jgi:hypothetical protein
MQNLGESLWDKCKWVGDVRTHVRESGPFDKLRAGYGHPGCAERRSKKKQVLRFAKDDN